MKMDKLFLLYKEGKIDKRTYWELMRERLIPLLEYQKIIEKNEECKSININEDNIFLTFGNNQKILFDFSQTVCRAEVILAATENEDFSLVFNSLPDNAVVFDIGANIGRFSIMVHLQQPNYLIYAFEPVPETFTKMRENLKLNDCSESIQSFPYGFYNTKKELSFFVPASDEAASIIANYDNYYVKEGYVGQNEVGDVMREVVCQVDTLDSFTEKNSITRIDFIKCDTEGAEKMVFEGGARIINQCRPLIYTELLRKHTSRFAYHPNEVINLVEKWGYQCCVACNDVFVPFRENMDSTEETNFFFLHREKHKALIMD